MKQPSIEIFQNGKKIREVSLEADCILLGRDPKNNISLEDQMISRNHAEIRKNGNSLELFKRSKFGWIRLNGKEIDQSKLKDGDRIEMGPFELLVRDISVTEGAPVLVQTPDPVQLAPLVAAPAVVATEESLHDAADEVQQPQETQDAPGMSFEDNLDSFSSPNDGPDFSSSDQGESVELNHSEPNENLESNEFKEQEEKPNKTEFLSTQDDGNTKALQLDSIVAELIFEVGAANVQTFILDQDEISIGRSTKCNVVLEDTKSSRKHAIIRKEKLNFILSDLGSSNGTYVNGNKIDQVELNSGDVIRIGDTEFKFRVRNSSFESKKDSFLAVEQPPEETSESVAGFEQQIPQASFMQSTPNFGIDISSAPTAEPPVEEKKPLFRLSFIDNMRTRPVRVQIIMVLAIIGGFYLLFFDEAAPPPPPSAIKKAEVREVVSGKPEEKPASGLPTFETLSEEQKRYVESQYKLGMDYYKAREFEKSLFEIRKIFSIVQDYQQAREIESYAMEALKKLADAEEKRKRQEQEKANKLKLEGLIQNASEYMSKKKYHLAEEIFPEIEILEPENLQVAAWREEISAENQKIENEKLERQKFNEFHDKIRAEIDEVLQLRDKDRDYYGAIEELEEIFKEPIRIKAIKDRILSEIQKTKDLIAFERDPHLDQAKELEANGELTAAFSEYKLASIVDPKSETAKKGMARTRGILNMRGKHMYTEGVFAESFGDLEAAEEKYRQVLKVVPSDDPYYDKANSRLKRLTVMMPPKTEDMP